MSNQSGIIQNSSYYVDDSKIETSAIKKTGRRNSDSVLVEEEKESDGDSQKKGEDSGDGMASPDVEEYKSSVSSESETDIQRVDASY